MLYIVQRVDVDAFAPAKSIDKAYAEGLKQAIARGIEIIVMQAKVTPEGIVLVKELPALLD
jgi:sugar fermentation stimulation protein A